MTDARHEPTAELQPAQWSRDDLASMGRITVHGEALVIRVLVEQPEEGAWENTVQKLLSDGRIILEKTIKEEFGPRYEADFISATRDAIELHVAGYPAFPTKVFGKVVQPIWKMCPATLSEASNIWILKADRVAEKVRRWVRDDLLKNAQQQIEILVQAEWNAGQGVESARGPQDSSELGLRARLQTLRTRELYIRDRQQSILATCAVLVSFGTASALAAPYSGNRSLWALAGYAALSCSLLLVLSVPLISTVRRLRMEAQRVEDSLELSGLLSDDEKRAHKLFQIDSAEVRRYYEQALRQRRYIFYVGVLCIILGFGCVFLAFSLIWKQAASPLSEKIVVAVLGAVGAVLANFVAIIFLNMFTAVVKSMVEFHSRLVSTHHVVFGNVLVARIEDKKSGMRHWPRSPWVFRVPRSHRLDRKQDRRKLETPINHRGMRLA